MKWGLLGLVMLTALPASAGFLAEVDSPRTMRLDVRFGSYRPRIDEQFDARSTTDPPPYEQAFGSRREVMTLVGLELIAFDAFGTLSAGITSGFWDIEGSSIEKAGGGAEREGEDATSLEIIPVQAQLTYRFDVWQDLVFVVPVFRFGLDSFFWTVRDDDGDVANFEQGQPAEGTTLGWHVSFGVHFLLDFLAPKMAGDFDRQAGVNNSYLTAEYLYSKVDDFGEAESLRLGDGTLFIGFALDL